MMRKYFAGGMARPKAAKSRMTERTVGIDSLSSIARAVGSSKHPRTRTSNLRLSLPVIIYTT